MFNQKDLEALQQKVAQANEEKDALNKLNRDIIAHSKKAMVFILNNEQEKAKKILEEMKKQIQQLVQYQLKNNTIGLQEYVETEAYYYYLLHQSLLPYEALEPLGIDHESYLKGIFDFIGELVRKAVLAAIREHYEELEQIYYFVRKLYEQFSFFDFHGELRKGFDSMRWNLKKLEDMMFEIKLKGKLRGGKDEKTA